MIKSNNNKKKWLGTNGKYLSEENVVQILVRYAMPHPDLTMIDRMKDIGSKQALSLKKKLNHLETKSLNILYIFLRQFMFLYHTKLKDEKENDNRCTFSIGILCHNHRHCGSCVIGLKGKKTTVKNTKFMGNGLFAAEDIKKDTYIVEYKGTIKHRKPTNRTSYVVEINYESRNANTDKRKTCYIDAENSTTNGRYANHSCVNNAVICKMSNPTRDIPFIWIKSKIDIKQDEEIFVNYGNEYNTLLFHKGGCKCEKCYGEPIEPDGSSKNN